MAAEQVKALNVGALTARQEVEDIETAVLQAEDQLATGGAAWLRNERLRISAP